MDCRPRSAQFLGNAGGFSGARLWRLQSPVGELCLRRWPAKHPDAKKLTWMHNVLAEAYQAGCSFLPVPIENMNGNRFVRADGHLWELTPWMPGEASIVRGDAQEKLRVAMTAIASFHNTAIEVEVGVSPGVNERAQLVDKLLSGLLVRWQNELPRYSDRPFYAACTEILARSAPLIHALPATLGPLRDQKLQLQPCLRDIWQDHVLFEGNRVSGIIDFGAMRMELVACDIARFITSVAHSIEDAWDVGLAGYQQARPISRLEVQAVHAFAKCNIALSGINWVRWLMFENRSFDNLEGVHRRLETILMSLR